MACFFAALCGRVIKDLAQTAAFPFGNTDKECVCGKKGKVAKEEKKRDK